MYIYIYISLYWLFVEVSVLQNCLSVTVMHCKGYLFGWISTRWDVGIWTGLGWPRIETGGERL